MFRRWFKDVMPEVGAENQVTYGGQKCLPARKHSWTLVISGDGGIRFHLNKSGCGLSSMVLCHSRHMFVSPVFRMDKTTWVHCHIEAFGVSWHGTKETCRR